MLRNFATACLLIFVGLVLDAPASESEPKTVTFNLVMVDYRFIPDHLTFRHGVRYRLHMENHGKETHEVTAPVFYAAAKPRQSANSQ